MTSEMLCSATVGLRTRQRKLHGKVAFLFRQDPNEMLKVSDQEKSPNLNYK